MESEQEAYSLQEYPVLQMSGDDGDDGNWLHVTLNIPEGEGLREQSRLPLEQ